MDRSDTLRLLSLCAIRVDGRSPDWNVIARQCGVHRGLDLLYDGEVVEDSTESRQTRDVIRAGLPEIDRWSERAEQEVEAARACDAELVTVLDDAYPANLLRVPDLPPFLFYRGELLGDDAYSVAVVGTRQATDRGLAQSSKMARLLAEKRVTVVSGLARGVDTAAHRATLAAGGRTIAVLGTGITKCYPPENEGLAEEIPGSGALVSQFWPTSGAARWTFPRRNAVTSGITQGTVVVEASATSGAKMQARLALQHGKRVWLLRSLVTDQQWARTYVEKRGAVEVSDVDEVVAALASPERIAASSAQRRQLSLL